MKNHGVIVCWKCISVGLHRLQHGSGFRARTGVLGGVLAAAVEEQVRGAGLRLARRQRPVRVAVVKAVPGAEPDAVVVGPA